MSTAQNSRNKQSSKAPRRRPGIGHGGDEGGDGSERWTVSYMDMITVLMCLFVVLYAISAVDQEKYEALSASLSDAFGVEAEPGVLEESGSSAIDLEDPPQEVIIPAEEPKEEEAPEVVRARAEANALLDIQHRIEEGLDSKGLGNAVNFNLDSRGLTIRLVSSDTFFESGRANLTGEARGILDVIGPVVANTDYESSIEGHADYRSPTGTPYPTNWELSSDRAVQVLRYMVSNGGISQVMVAAVGYGDARPVAPGDSAEALAQNRRVDIVVLSKESESVRELLPQFAEGK